MDRSSLKEIVQELKSTLNKLESIVYSDKESYTLDISYDEVLKYEDTNDNDGEY